MSHSFAARGMIKSRSVNRFTCDFPFLAPLIGVPCAPANMICGASAQNCCRFSFERKTAPTERSRGIKTGPTKGISRRERKVAVRLFLLFDAERAIA